MIPLYEELKLWLDTPVRMLEIAESRRNKLLRKQPD